jgi:hypothetical protein
LRTSPFGSAALFSLLLLVFFVVLVVVVLGRAIAEPETGQQCQAGRAKRAQHFAPGAAATENTWRVFGTGLVVAHRFLAALWRRVVVVLPMQAITRLCIGY